jgi:hypothetical protein
MFYGYVGSQYPEVHPRVSTCEVVFTFANTAVFRKNVHIPRYKDVAASPTGYDHMQHRATHTEGRLTGV